MDSFDPRISAWFAHEIRLSFENLSDHGSGGRKFLDCLVRDADEQFKWSSKHFTISPLNRTTLNEVSSLADEMASRFQAKGKIISAINVVEGENVTRFDGPRWSCSSQLRLYQ